MLHYCRYDFCGRMKHKEKSLKNGGFYAVECHPAFFGDFLFGKNILQFVRISDLLFSADEGNRKRHMKTAVMR